MFPEYSPQLQAGDVAETAQMGKSFLFDFDQGDFVVRDGKLQVVEGLEALRVWIKKVLSTEKFKFKIYNTGESNEYGTTTLLELVNSGHPPFFIQAEIQREVTEALLRNPEITGVGEFTFLRERRTLIVGFTVNSIYGTTSEEVRV